MALPLRIHQSMAFDQEEFIRLATDYYDFCHRVYWQEYLISRAP